MRMKWLITRLLLGVTLLTYSLAPFANQRLAGKQAPSNPFKFDHLSTEQGLSQRTILCILQDRHGFMWFGTQDGLNKYDGQHFTIYRRDEADERSLLDNYILSLFEDRAGHLWVGTNKGGLSRYEPETETFTHFLHDPNNPRSLSLNTITAILEDANGRLWVGTDGDGLNRFDPRTNQATRFNL